MTVSTVVDHNDYTGNGVTTSFPYTFRIFKKTDLAVSVVDLSENITVLVLDTDYTVTNAGGYNGGSVVLTTPLANGWQISISRELEPTQETDLRNQGKFFAEVHEDAFDKLTMLIQQVGSMFRLALRKPSSIANWYDSLNNYIRNLKDPRDPQDAATKNYVDTLANSNLSRTLRVPEPIPQLPDAATRANKIPAFDNAGDPIVVLPPSGSASEVLIELSKPTGAGLIGLDPSGTVADAVTYVTPEMFGAIGDDPDKDDYAALQAAIDTRKPLLLSKRIYHTSLPLRVYTGTVIHGAGTSKSVIRKVGTAGLTDQPAITDPWGTSRVYNGIDAIIIALPNSADIDTDGGLTGGITRVVTGLSFSDFAVDRHAPRSDRWDPATGLRHYLNRSYVQTTSSGYAFLTYAMAESAFKNIYLTCCEDGFWSNNSWVTSLTDVRSECRAPFTINAGTSISMNSCYAINANPRTSGRNYYGYDLSCNYTALNACAADGTGRDGFPAQAVYYIGGQVTMNGCGCEVTHAVRIIDIKGYSSVNFNNFNVHVFNNKYNTDGSTARGWIRVGEAAKLNINGLYSSNFLQSDSVNPATGLKPVFAEVGTAALFSLEGAFSVGTNNRITGVNDSSFNQVYLSSASSSFRFKGIGTELDYSVVNGEDSYTGPHVNQNYTRQPIVVAHDVTPGSAATISLGSRVVTSNPRFILRASGTQYQDGAISVSNSTTPSANFSGSVMQYSAGVHQFTGSVRPTSDNTYNLGAGSNRWAAVFAANGTIQTSDKTKKKDIQSIDERVLSAWSKVQFYQYRWKDGDNKKHFGVIAQEVISAFESEGLNALDYGVVVFEEGVFGVSYSEAMILEMALIRSKM